MKRENQKLTIDICEDCKSRVQSIFKELKPKQLDILSSNKCGNIYKKGQFVFTEGNRPTGLFCVNTGKIKIYKVGLDGKEQIVRLAKDGEVIGYRSLISGELYQASASALEESVICFIPKNVFFGLIQSNADLSMNIVRLISNDLRRAEKRISDMAQKTVKERLAETLLMLKEFGGFEKDHKTIDLSLTRDDLANIVGSATATTIRLLIEFKNSRYIDLKGKKIKILNTKALSDIAKICD
jgi:CRP/FNR family transcriptional regulator